MTAAGAESGRVPGPVRTCRRPRHRGVPLAEVAASCGYADRSHLSREIVRLRGDPPRALVRAGTGLIMISSRWPDPARSTTAPAASTWPCSA
jgi:AraC-like DNA-binding protein